MRSAPPDPARGDATLRRRALQTAKRLSVGIVVAAIGLSATDCRQKRPEREPHDKPGTKQRRADPNAGRRRASVQLPDAITKGVCLAHNWQNGGTDGYGSDQSRETLRHLNRLGVNAVSLTPFGWMSDLSDTRIRGEHNSSIPDGGESRSRLERMVDQADAHQMRVTLKPHIWIRGGKWRGNIEPTADGKPAWDEWWESYRAFIEYYARMAADLDVEALVVGVELVSAIRARPEAFRATIRAVREIFDGHLTYGANWDEELPEAVWRELDAVGVQFYPPLTDTPTPKVPELRRAIRRELGRWSKRAEALNKPLDLVEVGYKSAASAVQKPFGWPNNLEPGERSVDRDLQRRAYRALFGELARSSTVRSVYIWKYFTDPERDEGGRFGFSPRGKSAEKVLRRAYTDPSAMSDRSHPSTESSPVSP